MTQSNTIATQKMSRTTILFWILTIILPLLVFLIPTGERFTPEIRLFLAITEVSRKLITRPFPVVP